MLEPTTTIRRPRDLPGIRTGLVRANPLKLVGVDDGLQAAILLGAQSEQPDRTRQLVVMERLAVL